MKTMALFGGSGGLGNQLIPLLKEKYNVMPISSKMINIKELREVQNFFRDNDVDIVVNATGANYDAFVHKISDKNINDIKNVIDVNIMGNVNILSSCLPKMREKNYGRIIIFSSILSTRTVPGTSMYSSTKSFIDTLVRVASAENISKHITCNSIRLGYFDGGMCNRIPSPYKEDIKESIGLKRWGSIPELYNTIDYMIETEFITGQNLNIEGGMK